MKPSCALTIVAPTAIKDANLIASNLPESSFPEWNVGTTYALGDIVYLPTTHREYKSAIAGNVGKNPATDTESWVDNGPTNKWAPFDASVGTQAIGVDGLITYQFRLGTVVSYMGLLNLTGASTINVRVMDPLAGEVYNKTVDLQRRPEVVGWWNWFFGPRTMATQSLFDDLPPFRNADIFVTITGGDDLALGVLLFGLPRKFSYGVQYGARLGIQDYSRKERTPYGDYVFVERAFAKRASFTMLINAGEVDPLSTYLARIRTTPVLWVGSDRFEATTIYGIYKNYELVIAYPEYSVFELELEGLT